MQEQPGDFRLPWHASLTLGLAAFLFLYLQNDMAKSGWWGDNWWPLLRLLGGVWLALIFVDRAIGGPSRRARKRLLGQ